MLFPSLVTITPSGRIVPLRKGSSTKGFSSSGGGGGEPPPPPIGGQLPPMGVLRRSTQWANFQGMYGDVFYDHNDALKPDGSPRSNFRLRSIRHASGMTSGGTDENSIPAALRGSNIRLAVQGYVPCGDFWASSPGNYYIDALANANQTFAKWAECAQIYKDFGWGGLGNEMIFCNAEGTKSWKKWMPSAQDITSGRHHACWQLMVDGVRSVLPETKFAQCPFSSSTGSTNYPSNGILSKNAWHVQGNDSRGKPWTDYWGCTWYFQARDPNCFANAGCVVTNAKIQASMDTIYSKIASGSSLDTEWDFPHHINYGRQVGKRIVISELGIVDRFVNESDSGWGDQPFAIDLQVRCLVDFRQYIEAALWFNTIVVESGNRFYTAMDNQAGATLINSGTRLKQLIGPNSPYR